ncbi:hypothetical protein JTB14_033240 [Gonioctena quinquepunctata]|nr:hypothetical protein JTB14_033240 [Gonioctena quinquepunctata]
MNQLVTKTQQDSISRFPEMGSVKLIIIAVLVLICMVAGNTNTNEEKTEQIQQIETDEVADSVEILETAYRNNIPLFVYRKRIEQRKQRRRN